MDNILSNPYVLINIISFIVLLTSSYCFIKVRLNALQEDFKELKKDNEKDIEKNSQHIIKLYELTKELTIKQMELETNQKHILNEEKRKRNER